jgi:hypothetical protein
MQTAMHAEQTRLEKGRCYRWSEVLGKGDGFLRYEDGRIVSAALRPKLNPDAPRVILVGQGPRRERSARLLCEKGDPVAIYLKRGINRWEYVGEFSVERWSEDESEIREHERRAARDDVARVIYLRSEVGDT